MRVNATLRRTAVVAALVTGLAPAAMAAAQADGSAWPSAYGDAQHSRQGDTTGPWIPSMKWLWNDPRYEADGSIGGTAVNIPGILDGSGRVIFKARNNLYDDRPGDNRYDLLALDPDTGQHSVLLPDVQSGQCVPAVGNDGIVWAMQDINERTDPGTGANPPHGKPGHRHLTHHPEASSWLVGINPETGIVEERYSGEGMHPVDQPALKNCMDSLSIASDGAVVFRDSAEFDTWLRVIAPDGTPRWELNITEEYGTAKEWVRDAMSPWQLIAPDRTPGAGNIYLGFQYRDPDSGNRTAGLASFDPDSGALLDSVLLPGSAFESMPVVDPEGGILTSITGRAGSPRGSGALVRVTDDGAQLRVDWQKAITPGATGPDQLEGVPTTLHVANERVVGFAPDLFSLDWADGELNWVKDIGFVNTRRLLVDAPGNIYVAKLSSTGEPKLNVYSPSGTWIGMNKEVHGVRTLGPLAADGTLYVWGKEGNTWWALEHDPDGVVPCPEGTSGSVVCRRNPAGGYVMRGTGADETFVGSPRPDKMLGRGGDDVMRGKGQEDLLYGGRGNDVLVGGGSADDLFGGPGKDRLYGNAGRDRLVGGSAADRLVGGSAADRLEGGSGPDKLFGNSGPDVLRGNKGNDRLVGGSGRDTFRAHGGKDVINAKGQRREKVNCGTGRDKVRNAKGDRVARNCERVRR